MPLILLRCWCPRHTPWLLTPVHTLILERHLPHLAPYSGSHALSD